MAFSDWLLIGGIGMLLRSEMKKDGADKAEVWAKDEEFMHNLKDLEAEWDRD